MKSKINVITITDQAAEQIKKLVANTQALGIRLSVNKKGCSGQSYVFQLVFEVLEKDQTVEHNGAVVFVDPLASLMIWGTIIDWETFDLTQKFTFKNPNEVGRCGCGESFQVDQSCSNSTSSLSLAS